MLRFTCGECGKRFSTTDDPAPGHVYRVPCKCGSTVVVQVDERGQAVPSTPSAVSRRSTPTEPLPLRAASDDPFVRAMMDAPWQPAATTPVAGPRLARRDPHHAGHDAAAEQFFSYQGDAELPETTRPRRLAGTRALLLDASIGLREFLAAGVRHVLRSRRLVAGGAALGAIAFAAGLWVGAASTAARWKGRAAAGAGAEARSGTAEPPPGTLAALGPAAGSVAAAAPAPIAARGEQPSGAAPASGGEATKRRDAPHPAPAPVRPAAVRATAATAGARVEATPAATGEPRAIEAPSAEEPATAAEPMVEASEAGEPTPAPDPAPRGEPVPAADRMPIGRQAAMPNPSERREVEAASDSTLTVFLNREPDAEAATEAKPSTPESEEALPVK